MGDVAHWRPKDCLRKNLVSFELLLPSSDVDGVMRMPDLVWADKHWNRPLSATVADGVVSVAALLSVSRPAFYHCLEQTQQSTCLKKSKMQAELFPGMTTRTTFIPLFYVESL